MTEKRYPHAESSVLELKSHLPKNDQIIKTLIGFCNQYGGKIVVGVSEDRKIVGLPDKEIEECLEWMEKCIFDASFPPIIPRVSVQHIGDKNLLEIEVSSGMNKPYYRKSEGIEKGTYVRLGRSTARANPEMIEELRWQSSGRHFEKFPVYQANLDDMDVEDFSTFLKNRKNQGDGRSSPEMLEAYELMRGEHGHDYPTNAGILLFGKKTQKYLPESMIICTHFQGTEGRDVIATVDCEGTLFDQFNTALNFLLSRLTRSFKIEGVKRLEQLEVPLEALREVLLNGIVHRNYYLKSPTKIAIWADRIEVFSPGGFPGPIDVENLRAGRSYYRNPNICKIFREAGYIEKLGSGLIVLLDSFQRANLPSPRIVDGGDYVKCILPRPSAQEVVMERQELENQVLGLFDEYSELSPQEMRKLLGVSRASLNRVLAKLVEEGGIQRVGMTRAVKYRK